MRWCMLYIQQKSPPVPQSIIDSFLFEQSVYASQKVIILKSFCCHPFVTCCEFTGWWYLLAVIQSSCSLSLVAPVIPATVPTASQPQGVGTRSGVTGRSVHEARAVWWKCDWSVIYDQIKNSIWTIFRKFNSCIKRIKRNNRHTIIENVVSFLAWRKGYTCFWRNISTINW